MNSDAIVVGAGVIGCSIAFELAKEGYRVTVVDKAPGPGQGSTSASSAIVRFNYSSWAGVACSWDAHFGWKRWAEYVEATADEAVARFHRCGFAMLDVATAPRELYLPSFDRAGIPYEEWDAATLGARIPGLDTGRYWPPARLDDDRFWLDAAGRLGAVYTPDAGYVDDPTLAAVNLASAATRRGVTFLFKRRIIGVQTRHDRVSGVQLEDGSALSAPIVVNAAGPWSAKLNAMAGVGRDFTVSLRPLRQEVHHVQAPRGLSVDGTTGVVVADLDLGTYFRTEPGGGLLVGGTEPECDPLEWLDDPDDADPTVSKDRFDAHVTRVARRLPELSVPNRPRGIAGVYDVADDWTPIYDRTELPGFYVAIGTSGNQFKNAPIVGQLVATIIGAVEGGRDHDRTPAEFTTRHTGHRVDLGAFSRRRTRNDRNSGTVMG